MNYFGTYILSVFNKNNSYYCVLYYLLVVVGNKFLELSKIRYCPIKQKFG